MEHARRNRRLIAPLACLLGALAGCQVTPPDVLDEIARATGVEDAIVFRHDPEALKTASPEGTLTAAQAVRLALGHDPRIQADLARVRVAEAEANQARLLPNPILSIDLRFPHGAGSNTAFEATLTADLVSLLQKPGQIAAADKRLRASAADALTTALDVMSEVQAAYVAAQTADAEITNAENRGQLLLQLRDIARKRLEAGEGTRLDVLTLDAQIMEANLELSDLRLKRFEDRLNLAKRIGQPRSLAEWPLETWAAPPGGDPAPEEHWIAAALMARPEIYSKLWELRALGDDLTAAEFSPFVGGEIGPHIERDPEWRTGPTITVPLPIFDWGQAERAKLQAERLAARHELAGLQADVIQDVRLAYATHRHARQTLGDAREKLLPLQQQQMELARLAYQSGDSDLATLLLAETDLQMTVLKIVELEEKVTVARVKLQRAAGGAAVADGLEGGRAGDSAGGVAIRIRSNVATGDRDSAMKPWLKTLLKTGSLVVGAGALILAWTVYFHNDVIAAHVPGALHNTVKKLGQYVAPEPGESEPDPNLNEIPVHVGKVTAETLHRYIDGFGIVAPRPPRKDQMSGSASVASPIAGVVVRIDCQIGQKVKAGDVLVELDSRLAKSAADQAEAGLAQEEAALAALKATPRPEQVQIAQLAIEKAQGGLDFAQKNYDRQKQLAADQGTAGKNVEQAAADLAAARNDLAVAQKQLALLKASPTPEELRQEEAKVRQASAALAAARMQTQLGTITAPIDGTVVAINVNPGDSIDTTRTLINLIALDRLMVDVDVPADELPAAPEGLAAIVTMATDPKPEDQKTKIEGKVTFISPQVEPKNGAVMIGIDLPADVGVLRPGLTVRVRIVAEEHKNVLAAPREAVVLNENDNPVVAVVTGETAIHREVKTGLEENGLIEITGKDIEKGNRVVTQGAFGLRAIQQSRIRVVE